MYVCMGGNKKKSLLLTQLFESPVANARGRRCRSVNEAYVKSPVLLPWFHLSSGK